MSELHDAERLARHVLNATYSAYSDGTRTTAKTLFMDTVATGLAGTKSQTAASVFKACSSMPEGAVKVPGLETVFCRDAAAIATGFAIHCLEWDAVHEAAVVHALSVPTAALLAEAQTLKAVGGEEFLTALIAAIDIAAALGVATDAPLSFFRPATAGLIGAAAGVARLRGLDVNQTAQAVGLAYSQVHGTMQAHVEGSPALPAQVALSARAALTAVDLAQAGLTGPLDVLSGAFGYFTLIDAPGDMDRFWSLLDGAPAINSVSIKPYPSGRASHGVLGAIMPLIHSGELTAESFEGLSAHVPPLVNRLVGRREQSEMLPAYARLCLPFLVASAVTHGMIDPALFEGTLRPDRNLMALASKVDVTVDNNPDLNALRPQSLELRLRGREAQQIEIPNTLGSPENPLTNEEHRDKIRTCFQMAGRAGDDQSITHFTQGLMAFDTYQDIGTLWDYLPPLSLSS